MTGTITCLSSLHKITRRINLTLKVIEVIGKKRSGKTEPEAQQWNNSKTTAIFRWQSIKLLEKYTAFKYAIYCVFMEQWNCEYFVRLRYEDKSPHWFLNFFAIKSFALALNQNLIEQKRTQMIKIHSTHIIKNQWQHLITKLFTKTQIYKWIA